MNSLGERIFDATRRADCRRPARARGRAAPTDRIPTVPLRLRARSRPDFHHRSATKEQVVKTTAEASLRTPSPGAAEVCALPGQNFPAITSFSRLAQLAERAA